MKNHLPCKLIATKTLLAFGFAATVFAGRPAFADDSNNAAANPAKQGLQLKFDAGQENPGTNNYYGLPKEAFDRLSPDQMMALAASHKESDLGTVSNNLAAAVAAFSMFGMIAACVALGVSQRLKRSRMQHETLRLMIEKGQPIPPELLQPQDPPRRAKSDLRSGLILIGIGAGVIVLLLMQHQSAWAAGLIPLLMGVAFLITWKIESNNNGRPK